MTTERKYLPTFAELIDRQSIVLLKRVFIPENNLDYGNELQVIEQDINALINAWHGAGHNFTAYDLRMIMMVMLANRWIWENESKVRANHESAMAMGPKVLADLLRGTHSVNGVRNTAKNQLARVFGERQDKKVDCLAADLPKEFGNWNAFD